jgi:hypothetical protein
VKSFFEFLWNVLLLKTLWNAMQGGWKRAQEIKPYSWETSLLLSVFSWLVSLLIEDPDLKDVLSVFGWIFLIFGVGWALSGQKLPFPGLDIYYGPWVTGALTCFFLFQEQILNEQYAPALISWPLISAGIAALNQFIAPGPAFRVPEATGRQSIVIVVLFGILLSCWIQFYYVLQGWLTDYPSVLADNFERSNFVSRLDLDSIDPPQGVQMLNAAESVLQNELGNRPWGFVERWLVELEQEAVELERQAKAGISRLEESALWDLRVSIPPGSPEYTLRLEAVWQGPSSQGSGYSIEKICSIQQTTERTVADSGNASRVIATRVTCDPVVLPGFLRTRT